MANFLARNLIAGKIKWAQIENSKTYAKYADAVLVVLEAKGYMIDENGDCVPVPVVSNWIVLKNSFKDLFNTISIILKINS